MNTRWPAIAVLALAAALSGAWLYHLRQRDLPPALIGPPRSDYTLEAFELVALDAQGEESFSVQGPRLARHPYLGTLDIERPRLRSPDADGGLWTARADSARVSREAEVVELLGAVRIDGPTAAGTTPMQLLGEHLTLYPRENRIASTHSVTITGPGSILRGRDLDAHLDTRRFVLADFMGTYDTQR